MNIIYNKQAMILFNAFGRFSLLTLLTLVFSLSLAQDSERPMNQEEFTQMLVGNTLIGEWAGSPYKQFFDRGGNTIYIGDDGQRSQGYWRIREDGYYCSTWPPGQIENCYKVTLLGDELLWYSGQNRYTSYIVEGNQLSK
jgi:hypothetical protein